MMKMIKRNMADYEVIATGQKITCPERPTSTKEHLDIAKQVLDLIEDDACEIYTRGEITYWDGDKEKSKKLTTRQAKYLEIWGGLFNGNYPCPESAGFGFITKDNKWMTCSGADAQYVLSLLNLEEKEDFIRIEHMFNNIGWYHSDHNRFVSIIEKLGWKDGFKWVKAIVDYLWDISEGEASFFKDEYGYGERTHGDDEIVREDGIWRYTCAYLTTTYNKGKITFQKNK